MTNETKKLFDAPWEIRPCDFGYDVVSAYNSIAEDRIFVAHADSKSTAKRLARLPELYDALMEAAKYTCRYTRYMDTPKGCKPCEFKKDCPYMQYSDLLRKVRDGE